MDIFSINGTYTADYPIFVGRAKYSDVEKTTFDNSVFGNLESYVTDFIISKYDRDCTDGCVIPFKIWADVGQDITFDDLVFRYSSSIGSIEENNFYNVEKEDAVVNSDFGKLDLSKAGFKAPEDYGYTDFKIYLDRITGLTGWGLEW